MPTLPRPEMSPHQHRAVAESFGVDAPRYDRARPRYPQELVQRIVAASPGLDFLDVGCGTGIEARQFQAAGATVLGIEPDPRMADFARDTGVPVEVATIEAWEPAGRTFDAVIAGTAWHWVDPVAGAAKAAEVLRPGGRLAPFWHVFDLPPELRRPFAEVYRRVAPDSPLRFERPPGQTALDVYQAGLTRAADGMRAAGCFTEPEQWRYEWEQVYTRDELLDLLPTQGGLTSLAADRRAEVLAAVGAAIDRELGGTVRQAYVTVVVTAARKA